MSHVFPFQKQWNDKIISYIVLTLSCVKPHILARQGAWYPAAVSWNISMGHWGTSYRSYLALQHVAIQLLLTLTDTDCVWEPVTLQIVATLHVLQWHWTINNEQTFLHCNIDKAKPYIVTTHLNAVKQYCKQFCCCCEQYYLHCKEYCLPFCWHCKQYCWHCKPYCYIVNSL